MPTLKSVSSVQRRLENTADAMRQAQRSDGTVDLVKAQRLAGGDSLVPMLKQSAELTGLTAEQAQRQFAQLQAAIASAPIIDANRDGVLQPAELPSKYDDTLSSRLLLAATQPSKLATPAGRREAEAVIARQCTFHAETALGAEALKWAVRDAVTAGHSVNDPLAWDAINYSERSWQSKIPFFGREYREGQGHLSDAELKVRFGDDLHAYIERTRARVNARLLMDYETEYLNG